MTLEVSVAEVVCVADVFDRFLGFVRRFVAMILPAADSAENADVSDNDDNKSPPDLGVSTKDNTNTGDSFGRP